MSNYNLLKLENIVKKMLSEKRALHSFGVAKLAKSIAKANNVDEEHAYVAGLLHDITKEFDEERQNQILIENGEEDKTNMSYKVKHSFTSKYFIRDYIGIYDEDILDAVYNHTICNSDSKLAKIIYIADKRDETRKINDDIANLAHSDLDLAYNKLTKEVDAYLKSKGIRNENIK